MHLTESEIFLLSKIVTELDSTNEHVQKPGRKIAVLDLTVAEQLVLPHLARKLERACRPTQLTHLDSGVL